MGAYLSSPVTDKDLFEGSAGFVEYGGASMQGWRRTMEDAHIATANLGNSPDAAMFGVFDGHGGSEVARFCQKYMASEMTRLQQYQEGNVEDSLIEVFHQMDRMLKDDAYISELEQLRQRGEAVPGGAAQPALQAAQPNSPPTAPGEQPGEESMASTSEAIHLLRQVLMLRKMANQGGEGGGQLNGGVAAEPGPAPGSPSAGGAGTRGRGGEAGGEDGLPQHRVQAGCTAVVAVMKNDTLWVANAGDSRAVLCRDGRAVALSEDHKPAAEGERSRIHAAGGFISHIGGVSRVNGNLNLSRAIGDLKYKSNEQLMPKEQIITAEPDITKMTLQPGDRFLVLACDGVWDVKSNQQVVDFVSERLARGIPPSQAAAQLLDACLAPDPRETRGIGCDNMTAAIVVLKRHGAAVPLRRL